VTDTHPADPLAAPLPTPLRRLEPPQAPWPAQLVAGGGSPSLLVDTEHLPTAAYGGDAEHVLRPVEVFRTGTGHLALLPTVTRRLVAAPVGGPGAAVTLAVSIVRGLDEAAADLTGEWWCTGDDRPVFVPTTDGRPIRQASAALLRAAEAGTVQPLLDELADELDDPDPPPLDGWEERLFAVAPPAPLSQPMPTRRDRRPAGRGPRPRTTGVRETLSDAGMRVWRAARRPRGGRRSTLLAAAAAAAVVLVVGLSWPSGEAEGGTAPPGSADATASTAPSVDAVAGGHTADEPAVPASPADDPVTAAAELMERLRGCGDDQGCRAGALENPAKELPPGPALDEPDAALSLLDDLGGIAVVRADGRQGAQIVLIVAGDGTWLVRDVYDAADQP